MVSDQVVNHDMDQRKRVGRLGEEAAATYLRQNGYQILARNWFTRLGELDIIAQENQDLVFVEVRSTRGLRFGYGFQSVDFKKQQRVRRLALQYMKHHNLGYLLIRFDVISVLIGHANKVIKLDHIPNAF